MRVVELVARLHDVVKGQPLRRALDALVDGRRMQADHLIIRHVLPALALASEEFGIEAPSDDGVEDQVVVIVAAVAVRDLDKASFAGPISDFVESCFLGLGQRYESSVGQRSCKLRLRVFDVGQRLLTHKVPLAELPFGHCGRTATHSPPCAVGIVDCEEVRISLPESLPCRIRLRYSTHRYRER